MKKVRVVHNPTAGDADFSKEALLEKIRQGVNEVSYISTEDENWKDVILKDEDLIVLTGGDGTVRKFATVLLEKVGGKASVPVYLLPQGTANNIATTLNISLPRDFQFENIEQKVKNFNHGKISGIPEHSFFIEGVGYGIFPELIQVMKSREDISGESSDQKLQRTLKTLKKLAQNLKPKAVELEADGSLIKGDYLMAEILNTQFLGPRLKLAPEADVEDGYFNLVLIGESDRNLLLNNIEAMIAGKTFPKQQEKFTEILKVKKVIMKSSWPVLHLDDIAIENNEEIQITAEVVEGVFRFV